MASRYLFPGLAIVSIVTASSSCSISSTTTISNPAGASALASCTTFTGDVVLQTGTANAGIVDLSGLEEIDGSLVYENDDTVQTITAGSLKSVGDFVLQNLTRLSTISMAKLTTVADLDFNGLGSLASLGFGNPGIKEAGTITIINTFLNSLAGIDSVEEIEGFIISDNQYLQTISLNVQSISGPVDIGANDVNNGGQQVSFPNLEDAGEMTLRNLSGVSIPALVNVAANLGFYGNVFTSLIAPNLTSAGGIIFADNSKLTNISMPILQTINGTNSTFQIANNTALQSISGFGALTSVRGNVDFVGNFSTISLGKLNNVGGALTVSTSANFDCSAIQNLENTQVVKGLVTCSSEQSNPSSPTSTSSGGSAPASTSKGAAASMNVPILMGATTVFGAFLQMFL